MIEFEEMKFTPGLLKAIKELGFEQPMPVQQKVIPLMLNEGKDIIALAQTGTGKTAAFGLPLVLMTQATRKVTQSLILCPTRELCIQITRDLSSYAKYSGDLKILAVYGGSSIENQIRELKRGVHVIVATPGRLIDLIERRVVHLENVSTVVLDEADEMLNMGFIDSINDILDEVPEGRRTLLFSATMSPEISSIARKYMNNPVEITIGTKNASADNVKHLQARVTENQHITEVVVPEEGSIVTPDHHSEAERENKHGFTDMQPVKVQLPHKTVQAFSKIIKARAIVDTHMIEIPSETGNNARQQNKNSDSVDKPRIKASTINSFAVFQEKNGYTKTEKIIESFSKILKKESVINDIQRRIRKNQEIDVGSQAQSGGRTGPSA